MSQKKMISLPLMSKVYRKRPVIDERRAPSQMTDKVIGLRMVPNGNVRLPPAAKK
jgi:hypothetical protein